MFNDFLHFVRCTLQNPVYRIVIGKVTFNFDKKFTNLFSKSIIMDQILDSITHNLKLSEDSCFVNHSLQDEFSCHREVMQNHSKNSFKNLLV